MSLTITPARRRMKRRIENLPTAKHNCEAKGIWIRRPKVGLTCIVCGRP